MSLSVGLPILRSPKLPAHRSNGAWRWWWAGGPAASAASQRRRRRSRWWKALLLGAPGSKSCQRPLIWCTAELRRWGDWMISSCLWWFMVKKMLGLCREYRDLGRFYGDLWCFYGNLWWFIRWLWLCCDSGGWCEMDDGARDEPSMIILNRWYYW